MERYLAICIKDTTIENIIVGEIYKVEYSTFYKIIYNEKEKTFESIIGNKDWFREHFKPLRCEPCIDIGMCAVYDEGRDYACWGHQRRKNIENVDVK